LCKISISIVTINRSIINILNELFPQSLNGSFSVLQ
jgi:hypothetical protein